MKHIQKKVVLCILDGWGLTSDNSFDGTSVARNLPAILKKYPSTQLQASEHYVGLPEGQMGNSEVGHMTIGLGRVLMQDLPKIDKAFASGDVLNNSLVLDAIDHLKSNKKPCHLLGLMSPGGVHSHIEHIIKAAKLLANAGIVVHVHGFLDGRDTPPKSARIYLEKFSNEIRGHENINLSTLCGRYYAMDRDNRWDRIKLAYQALVEGKAPRFFDPLEAIEASYINDVTDEFVLPLAHQNYPGMADGDGLWMINFRSDRVRQILRSLFNPNFTEFNREKFINFSATLAMNEYALDLNPLIPSIFPKAIMNQGLGEIISKAGLKQLRVAETEKYAHVTFFLNGGQEAAFTGEERVMIPSPKVSTYDLEPEMSAKAVTDVVAQAMDRDDLSLVVVNYANTDMVGHTGVINSIYQAVECVDDCLKLLEEKAIQNDWVLLITSDHGNAECMRESDGQTPHTAHTCNPVPFVLVNGGRFVVPGTLADVAPTILDLMNIPKPNEMTGKSLLC